jgi:flagellar biosynthesis protein
MKTSDKENPVPSGEASLSADTIDPDGSANRVSAMGTGAHQLIEEAEARGIPIHDFPDEINLLLRLDLCSAIPEEIDNLISEILAWLQELTNHRETEPR